MWDENNKYDPSLHIDQQGEAMFWAIIIISAFCIIRWIGNKYFSVK